ncbi:MAG: hypothetical protein HYU28_05065, partial [Actinobacteria bacterium]|nr:hypothetical protein [Actinomycetota bacterium]
VRVGVRVNENGSGVAQARFDADADALEAIGGDPASSSQGAARALEKRLRVADLVEAGWTVEVDDGGSGKQTGATVVLEKDFATPDELAKVIDELSGDAGPFRDFHLTRKTSTFRTEFAFQGTVDLDAGIAGTALDPADAGIAPELADEDVEIAELSEFLRERIDEVFNIEVVVAMPGDGSHNAPGELAGEPRWTPSVGEAVELKAESSDLASDRLALVAFGLLLGGVSAAMFVRHRARRRDTLAVTEE